MKDYVQSADTEMQAGPQGMMKVKQKNTWLAPSGFRQDQELPFGKIIAAYDGKAGFLVTPQGTMAMPPPVVTQVEGEVFRNLFALMLSDRDATRKVNNTAPGMIEISGGEKHVAKVEFDAATGLMKKLMYVEQQMGGAPQNVEESFSDWREVGGLKIPFAISITQGGNKLADVKVQDFKINSGVTAEELMKR